MPRRPDLPCARCGELMWRGTGVLPEGQATCQPCRRAIAPPLRQPILNWTCQHCGAECTRPPTRGRVPKWCQECRARSVWQLKVIVCLCCGKTVRTVGKKFCSVACANQHRPQRPKKVKPPRAEPLDRRSDLRRAYESGDRQSILSAIRDKCITSEAGCWIWQGRLKKGYPVLTIGGVQMQAHRVSLESSLGASLGSQSAHHKCATPACVNPEHLQPITHRENVAEMLARQSYLRRIRELEQALVLIAPSHPLLNVVGVA